MSLRPVTQQESATAFYAALDIDVSFFAAIWHTYKVGHLLMGDLDRICLQQGLSMADVHLLGAVRADVSGQLRATDLAQILNVSNATLSTRIGRLKANGQLTSVTSPHDRRAFILQITPDGVLALDCAIAAIQRSAHFVAAFRRLPESDQTELVRIMGGLHDQLDRDFVSAARPDV
jgi:DNA-binding MarR family transcriptional regulator